MQRCNNRNNIDNLTIILEQSLLSNFIFKMKQLESKEFFKQSNSAITSTTVIIA